MRVVTRGDTLAGPVRHLQMEAFIGANLRAGQMTTRCEISRKRKQSAIVMNAAPYSEAKYNEVENVESSFEEDDWLLSDEEDEDNYRRPQNPKPKGQLERLQDMAFEQTGEEAEEDKKRNAESKACAIAMAKIAWDTKAEDVTVLHVAPVVYWTSYMVMATIKSRPQMQAVVAKIEQQAEQVWNRPISELARTSRGGEWEAIDLKDVVVHIFTAEQRERYSLDEYYAQAEEVELPFVESSDNGLGWSKSMPR